MAKTYVWRRPFGRHTLATLDDDGKIPLSAIPEGVGGESFVGELVIPMQKAVDVTSTTFANRYDPTIFDRSRYPADVTIHFRANLSQANPGSGQVQVRLASMTAGNTTVPGTTLTATVAQYNHSIQTTGDIRSALAAGAAIYSLEVRADAGFNGQILSPELVVRYPA